MSGHSFFNGQRFPAYVCSVCCVLVVVLTAGCGDESSNPATADNVTADSSTTGSAALSIRWHTAADDPNPISTMVRQAIDDCSAAGVTSITCEVYDLYDPSNNPINPIANGGPWPCDAREGRVERIPVGPNRTFVVLGWDSIDGNIVYQGKTSSDIDINPGEIADAGTIDAHPFVPTGLEATVVSSSRIDLDWDDPAEGLEVDEYQIYRNGDAIATSVSSSYSDTDLTQDTPYCYTVTAYDAFGNESGQSDQDCGRTPINTTWYRDADADTYGDPNDSTVATSQPDGYVADNTDCDDENNTIYPGAPELNDGLDNDCDGGVDEDWDIYYRDADGDTYGDPNDSTQAVDQPDGYVADSTDCNDDNASVHPNATEVCNDVDDNCNGTTDEGCNTYYRDADGDNYGDPNDSTVATSQPDGYVADNTDCDDENNTIYPGAPELNDGLDNDCDGGVDEDWDIYYRDADGDTYGDPNDSTQAVDQPEGYVADSTDCNDDNASVHPNATEVCNDVDDNCNGTTDEGCNTYYHDADADTYGDPNDSTVATSQPDGYVSNSSDCNDDDATIHPNATEVCNEVDDNCNGTTDEGCNTYYRDADGDNYGDPNDSTVATSQPDGYVSNSSDCNDDDASVHPNATEVCNYVDDNCNGTTDEGCNTYYRDADGDTYGDPNDSTWDTSRPEGYVADNTDCDDENEYINPGADEVCSDDLDNNCNGQINENCVIDVDIDNDFDYVAQGWPMGLSVGETYASELSESPYENLNEPLYYDLYGEFYTTYYGYLRMGNSPDDIVSFVIVNFYPDSYELFMDRNNNEDLNDDGGPIANQGLNRFGALVVLNIEVVTDYGTITRPYNLWMWFDDNENVRFYARCHYIGQLNIGGEIFTAVAFEDTNHDALYEESGLYIDLNGDSVLDPDTENFMDQAMITVNGQDYQLLLNYP